MYLFANWKIYLDAAETVLLAHDLASDVTSTEDLTIAVFPNALATTDVVGLLGKSGVAVGAQHVNWSPKGAYTGAISAHLYKQAGCRYALVGHSERRYVFGDSNEVIRKRFDACVDEGLTPVLCIGETQDDLDNEKREYRLKKQLDAVLSGRDELPQFVVAYEPVWAIAGSGGGEACDPVQAAEVHKFIALTLKAYTDASVPMLYGGSVSADNVLSYAAHPHIDGVLVGSASTTAEGMRALVNTLHVK